LEDSVKIEAFGPVTAYDTIAARIDTSAAHMETIGFTAVSGGEGTTTIALGTAIALAARQPEPVLLVDANWRAPAITEDSQAAGGSDLESCLRGTASLREAVVPSSIPTLFFLPTRERGSEPPLGTISTFFDEFRSSRFRYVLLDLPPVLNATASVMSWSAVLRRVFLIAARNRTRRRDLQSALDSLGPGCQPSIILSGALGGRSFAGLAR
jgi:Mrp family chromosome partitioning ATPase